MAELLVGGNYLNIRVWEFTTRPEPVRDVHGKETGEIKLVDYVEYGPPHLRNTQAVEARMDRVLRCREPRSQNNIHEMALWARKQFIEPLYDAWKRGEKLPDDGTPIAVLNFLRPEDVRVLKQENILTVEMLATLHESDLGRVRVPMIREKSKQARMWLEAQDANKAAAQMAARDATIADQAAELAKLKAMVEGLAVKAVAPVEDEDEDAVDENGDRIPRRRGRPPKVKVENEAA